MRWCTIDCSLVLLFDRLVHLNSFPQILMEFATKFCLMFLKSEVVYISAATYQKARYLDHSYPGHSLGQFLNVLQSLG